MSQYTGGAKKCIHILRDTSMYYVYTFLAPSVYIDQAKDRVTKDCDFPLGRFP